MGRKQDGLSRIKAIRFWYLGKDSERRIETLPFYLYTIKDFLRNHSGDVVWLKGGIIEQPAYLIFKSSLTEEVKEMLSEEFEERRMFKIEPVENPIEIVRKYVHDLRAAVGWLKLPSGIELGSLESLLSEDEARLTEIVRKGIQLSDSVHIRADRVKLKFVPRKEGGKTVERLMAILENMVELGLTKDKRISYVKTYKQFGLWKEVLDGIEVPQEEGKDTHMREKT